MVCVDHELIANLIGIAAVFISFLAHQYKQLAEIKKNHKEIMAAQKEEMTAQDYGFPRLFKTNRDITHLVSALSEQQSAIIDRAAFIENISRHTILFEIFPVMLRDQYLSTHKLS